MTRFGVDYSSGRPSAAALKAAGYSFACRYLAAANPAKNPLKALTRAEADALRAGGIDLVSNWETTADRALDGRAAGIHDAQEAAAKHLACGGPPERPIYFSVDFDAAESQQPAINAYFQGVASVIGLARTGAYGGYWVISRLLDAGLIRWGWQTYAWSGGHWDARAHLRQIKNGIKVAGADCDRNQAMADDFGQWGYEGDDMTKDEHDMLVAVHAAVFLGGASMGPAVPAADRGPDSVTGNSLVDLVQHSRQVLDGLGTATGGLTDADRAAIQKLTDAVTALNDRMASP